MNPTLLHAIEQVRQRVRLALAWETLARAAVVTGAFLWFWLLADWMIEPSSQVRAVVLSVAGVALLVWLLRHSLSALLMPLPDRVIASWIEQRWPELGDSLLTVLSGQPNDQDTTRVSLLDSARGRATQLLRDRPTPGVVDVSKLRAWFAMAGLAVASFTIWAMACPQLASVYAQRLALAEVPWPRQVMLEAANFTRDAEGRLVRRVARNGPFELDVRALLTDGHTAPGEVRATLRMADGSRIRQRLAAVGEPTAGGDAHQAYRTKLDRLRQDLVIYLRGGDGRLGPLYVQVSPRPAITSIELEVLSPDYLHARLFRQPASAVDRVPEGATVRLVAVINKPLHRVAATLARADSSERLVTTQSEDATSFTLTLTNLRQDGVVELSLMDTDGIESEEPYRLPIRIQDDQPPRVEFGLVGIGRTITADAVLPTRVRVEDDHAIDRVALSMSIEDTEHAFPIDTPAPMAAQLSATPEIDLLSLRSDPAYRLGRMEPGQQVKLHVAAWDKYDLAERPPTFSQTETLTVVTAEELSARLEEVEQNLRETFEHVYDEARGAQLNSQRMDEAPDGTTDEDRARRRRLSMARLVERLGKVGDETNAVAEGFQAILAELDNNRVPNEDLKDRIKLRIVTPLRQIVSKQLPVLQTQASAASDALTDDPQQPALPGETKGRLDQLVRDMELALKEMKAVETYNEVLALLRGIIDDQRNLSRKTDDARKSSLKDLLLD